MPSQPVREANLLDERALKKLLGALKQAPGALPAVVLLAETGARPVEICNARWRDVDWQRSVIHVEQSKNGHARDIPLNKAALIQLYELRGRGKPPDEYIVGIRSNSLSSSFNRAVKRAGLPRGTRLHSLRHTRLTELARKGLNIYQLKAVSGHRNIASLGIYARPRPEDVVGLLD